MWYINLFKSFHVTDFDKPKNMYSCLFVSSFSVLPLSLLYFSFFFPHSLPLSFLPSFVYSFPSLSSLFLSVCLSQSLSLSPHHCCIMSVTISKRLLCWRCNWSLVLFLNFFIPLIKSLILMDSYTIHINKLPVNQYIMFYSLWYVSAYVTCK